MAGIKQFSQEVHGTDKIIEELEKANSSGKRTFIMATIGAISGVLGLVVAVISLIK